MLNSLQGLDLVLKFACNYKRNKEIPMGKIKAKGNQQLLTNSGEQQGQDKNNTDTTINTKNKRTTRIPPKNRG